MLVKIQIIPGLCLSTYYIFISCFVHYVSCLFTFRQLFVYIFSTFCLHFRMSSRRSSSEERDGQNADSYISDNFSTLSVSTSNIPNHFTNRMSQYSPRYVHIFLIIQVFLIIPKWFFLVYFQQLGRQHYHFFKVQCLIFKCSKSK